MLLREHLYWLVLLPKFDAENSNIGNKQCEGDREMNRKHLSNVLEMFWQQKKQTRNIKLLHNFLNTILLTSIESERAEHD